MRIRRCLQKGLLTLAAVACLHVGAQTEDPLPKPATLEEALEQAFELHRVAAELVDNRETWARCAAVLEPWTEVAWKLDTRDAKAAERVTNFVLAMAGCTFHRGSDPLAVEPISAWMQPWHERLRKGASDPLFEIKWVFYHQWLLQLAGWKEEGLALLRRQITARIERLRQDPKDQQALADLTYSLQGISGSWHRQDEVRMLHDLLEQGLGEGHRLHVLMLRTMSDHVRFLGRPQEALALVERGAALARQHHADDRMLNVRMDEVRALCLSELGRFAEAMEGMTRVQQAFAEQMPVNHYNLMRIHTNLAGIALSMGALDDAVAHADRSLEHSRLANDRLATIEGYVAMTIREEARLQQGAADGASRLRDALELAGAGEMHVGPQAFELVRHAVKTGDAALLAWATDFTDLHIRRFRGPLQADSAYRPLMQAWRTAGYGLQGTGARPLLDRAVAISLNGRSPGTLATTVFNLARERSTSDPESAIWLYKIAANTLQRLRTGLPSTEPELHRTWLGAYEADLRQFIGLLIDQGRLTEAEQAMAALRDEEGQEFSRRSLQPRRQGSGRALSYTPIEQLRDQGWQAAAAQAERATQAADVKLDKTGRPMVRTAYQDEQAEADIQSLSQRVQSLVDEKPAVARSLPAQALQGPRPPRGTARLSYFMRDAALDILLSTHQRDRRVSVPVSRVQLNRLVQQARAALSNPQQQALPALQALHRVLLAPVAAQLRQEGTTRLQVVPDAAVRYVPFAALHDGRRFIVERYTVSSRWSGSDAEAGPPTTARPEAPRSARQGGLLALGRTAGDDEHAALPAVQDEMNTARGLGAAVLLDEDFTLPRLQEALQRGPAVVHLASHFALDPGGAEKSYLLLGDGSHLALSKLSSLPWQGVDLAVLSACDSGLPLSTASGQALVGFASSLQQSGVKHVLATLWRISDGATARWVDLFYREGTGRRPAQVHAGLARLDARRVAHTQRLWLQRQAGTPWAHPHYWAAFTWLDRE